MWNSAVFIAAFVVLAVLFVLCPLRVQMVGTGDPCRIDRAATDALSERRKWQDAYAKAPSLGLYA